MTQVKTYSLRPLPKPVRTDLKDVFRVYLSSNAMASHQLQSGSNVQLRTDDGRLVPAIAWNASERIQDSVIQTSKIFQELHGLKLGGKITLEPGQYFLHDAKTVTLCEVERSESGPILAPLNGTESKHWAWFLEYVLLKAEVLCPSLVFNDVELKGQKRSFRVEAIDCSRSVVTLFRFTAKSNVEIIEKQDSTTTLKITGEGIGGLAKQVDLLNRCLSKYADKGRQHLYRDPPFYQPFRGGILLHGPHGTGKGLLVDKVRKAGWRKVLTIDQSSILGGNGIDDQAMGRIFTQALLNQPSLIVIDGLDTMSFPSGVHDTRPPLIPTQKIIWEFERLKGARVLVIAATRSLKNIDSELLLSRCFENEIEIPVPNFKARREILKVLTKLPKDAEHEVFDKIGDRTHGYVGFDLHRLLQVAFEKANDRFLEENPVSVEDESNVQEEADLPTLDFSELDLNDAMSEVRPSALSEMFLDNPNVRWTDVGGYIELKKALEQAVEWPLKHQSDMDAIGVRPKKGLLLYGPPGCSKTLLAKATATESGLNFIAIKGAEFLSMYVGESERALREIFRQAKAATPSMIFFDEIDAIGGSRSDATRQGGLQVLTTLLNEVDGIEVLKGVFVLAATNHPEALDPALIRPGRFDNILYAGPPDYESRYEILKMELSEMDTVDGLDLSALAEVTEGCSGAEVVAICQSAGYAALGERMSSGQPKKIRYEHLSQAVEETPRQITPEMKAKFEDWSF